MRKYRLGILVIVAFSILFFGYVLFQGSSSKADAETYKAAQNIADKLNTYTIDKGPPEDLAKAGISKVPSTIKYTKKSDTKYELCMTYKYSAGSGIDPPSIFIGRALNGGTAASDPSSSGDYGYLYISASYKKGTHCQTVTTYSYNSYNVNTGNGIIPNAKNDTSNLSGNDSACATTYDSYYTVQGQAIVSSVDETSKTIKFQTSGQSLIDSQTGSLAPVSSKTYDDITLFCDANHKATTAASIKSGQKVKIFMYSADSTVLDKVEL